jgi:hypothetical protein
MSNVEHIFENTICKLEKGVYDNMTYIDILKDIQDDTNYDLVAIHSDDVYTMAVYAYTTYRYSIRNKLLNELKDAGVDLAPWIAKISQNLQLL